MFRKKHTPQKTRQRAEKTNSLAAFSYHARRSEQAHPASERQAVSQTNGSRHGRKWTAYTYVMAGVLMLFSLLGLYNTTLVASPAVVIEPSSQADAVLRDTTEYARSVEKFLQRSSLNRNKITVTTSEVSRSLLAQFPELDDAQLVLPFFGRTPALHLRAGEPVLLIAASNGTYALSSSGTALVTGARLSQLSDLKLPLITDENGFPVTLHKQALTAADVSFIRNVVAQLSDKNIAVSSLVLPAGKNQLDVRIAGQPYYVKFNLANNTAREQAGTYLALAERLREQNVAPAEYVDVRVQGRAYYR